MKKNLIVLLAFTLCFSFAALSHAEEGKKTDKTKCKMSFNLNSWAVFYKSGKGGGTINCDNGQSAEVSIRSHSGGISFGKTKIENGQASFSKVADITKIFGSYASAEAHAGLSKSAKAQVLTKGKVSMSLTGTGKGFDLGIAFGNFKVTPVSIDTATAAQPAEVVIGSEVAEQPSEPESLDAPPSVIEIE